MFAGLYHGKRVFVTGHTGFKGSWLSEWLLGLGAEVIGYSHRVNHPPDLFTALALDRRMTHIIGDVRDTAVLGKALQAARPHFVFHLAAQSLVRLSYREPVETIATNLMGTVHVLEALRFADHPVSCVIVTSDKCYENREMLSAYREDDSVGGYDPYSASKGAAEIVVQSYRRSFFSDPDCPIKVATARAGNVIGGGDWSEDRIIPDCIRSLLAKRPIYVRNPAAIRPWQHVLEPLSGYLWLGALMTGQVRLPHVPTRDAFTQAFNFGPWPQANRNVESLVTELLLHWPGSWQHAETKSLVHEAGLLNLAIDKAFHILQWRPAYNFSQGVATTARWYRQVADHGVNARDATTTDIAEYVAVARARGIAWATDVIARDR